MQKVISAPCSGWLTIVLLMENKNIESSPYRHTITVKKNVRSKTKVMNCNNRGKIED